ncbi:hypothetical protein RA2_02994 [Roseovarius sp. A-2]|uniref:hypothetical protein n=1 Tax=Roseovarius sp. A-2 TaxID=1570360 RepID=UPI0009B53CC0|nr:hypothetical protein [Roseovarius sp. A-2]GAW35926.1 hypothetical protein RA2_02994 [Roseovarius sp. A-2]
MPHDIHLTPASRPGHMPRFALGLGLLALLVAILASSPAPEPSNTTAAAPAHEDWHGNVRRSR